MPENGQNLTSLSTAWQSQAANATIKGVIVLKTAKSKLGQLALVLTFAAPLASGCTTTHAADNHVAMPGQTNAPLNFDCSGSVAIPAVEKMIRGTYANIGVTDNQPLGACYAAADLNRRGKSEILVILNGVAFSGSGGNPLFVFSQDSGNWQMLANGSQYIYKVAMGAPQPKSYDDLVGLSDANVPKFIMRYDGRQYTRQPQ